MLNRTSSFLWLAVLVTVGAAGSGCSSTKIVDSWRDPAQTGPLDFQRVLVVALAPDEYSRNVAEDTLVERIGANRAVAAHDVFKDAERWDRQKVKYELSKGSFDGVITMGIVGTRRIVSREAAQGADEPFYTYYDRAAAFTMQDYPEQAETVYRVETRIFTVKNERLVWSAVTDTVDPDHVRQITTDVAKAVGAELRKQKLIR